MAYFAYVYPQYGQVFDLYYIGTAFAVAALAVLAFQVVDIYHIHAFRRPASQLAKLTVAWSLVFLSLVAVMFFARLGDLYSRVWLAGFFGTGLLSLYAFRLVLYGMVRRWTREGRLDRRAVVVGGGEPGEALVDALGQQDRTRRFVCSACSTTAATTARRTSAADCPSSAPSTIWSNSRAAPASIWCCSRCRSRRRAASCRC